MSIKRCYQVTVTGVMAALNRRRLNGAAGVAALLVFISTAAHGQLPLASNELAAPEKTGVTLYQINGFTGNVPMKVETVFVPDAPYSQLEFASSNMNTEMQFMAKAVAPPGTIFKSLGVSTINGHHQVAPASADYFDGKKIVAKVTLSPWQLNNLLKQCREQLTNPDGTYKNSVTFDLEVGANVVHGKAVFASEADPGDPSKWQSRSATVHPKTRVTAYLVEPTGTSPASRSPSSLGSAPSGGRALPPVGPVVRDVPRPVQTAPQSRLQGTPSRAVIHPGRIVPRPLPRGAMNATDNRLRPAAPGAAPGAKPQFERTKPHVNPGTLGRVPNPINASSFQRTKPRVNSLREMRDLRLPGQRRQAVRLPR